MKPITILFFVLGLGIWLLLTSYQTIISKLSFSSLPDEMTTEVVMNGNYMSLSAPESENVDATQIAETSMANSEGEKSSEVAELTNVNVDEVSEESSLLLAENTVTKTDIDLIDSEESELEQSIDKQDLEVGLENEESLLSEIDAAQNVALTEEDNKQETNDTDLDADRDLEIEAEDIVKESESAAVQIEAEEVDDTKTDATSTTKAMSSMTPPINPYMYNMWMSPMQSNAYYPWMNPMTWMNPMYNMMNPMISMMGTMMNPAMYMNPLTMMNYPVTTLTQPQNMDAMMKSMDPQLMFGMFGMPNAQYDPSSSKVPDQLPVATIPGFPTQTYQNWPKNMPSESVSREAKMNAFQTAMAMSPLSMRNMVSMMTDKIPVDEDVSWDDAVEAMKLRANEVNFKFVGSSPLWKQIEAETEQPSTKVEIFRFCDARVARKILDEVPEFIIFLPCRIALLEDAEGKLWVMTLDWDVSWLDYAQNTNTHLPKDLREDAKRVRESLAYIMEGAATGDF